MRKLILLAASALLAALAHPALAGERYGQRPPVVLSPDLTAPWVMQLSGRAAPRGGLVVPQSVAQKIRRGQIVYRARPRAIAAPRTASVARAAAPKAQARQTAQLEPRFLPQIVNYPSKEAPGTIVVDTNQRFLYFVMGNGKARRYGVGVGREGFSWSGTHRISMKREWPDWNPPVKMIERVKRTQGRTLPRHMEGGPANPLGARALYIGSTLYRIHGTNAPWTIGKRVSSGCIRMRNEDVVDLYERAKVGGKVIVI